MNLPGSVEAYSQSVPLPDFDRLEPAFAGPPSAHLKAWTNLAEAARWRVLFAWFTWVQDHGARPRVMGDVARAYLMSFESTLQVLGHQRFGKRSGTTSLKEWLETQKAHYDLECRGLRTLRHLEAHVKSRDLGGHVDILADTPFAGPATGGRIAWFWSGISPADYAALRQPAPLEPSELDAWNACSRKRHVLDLMLHGLEHLQSLLTAAGP